MKTKTRSFLYVSIVILLSGTSIFVNAQDRPLLHRPTRYRSFSKMDTAERKNVFISYPTNFIAATLKIGYEFKVAHNKGLKLIGSYGSSNSSNDYYELNKFDEYGLEGQLRFYVLKDRPALNGFYLAPYLSYKSMNYQINNSFYNYSTNTSTSSISNATVGNFCVGYIIGYQYIYSSTLTIDAFIGGGDNVISGNNSGGSLSNSLYAYRSGIDLHTGIGIGVAF